MNKYYTKKEDGDFSVLKRVPYISNCSEQQLETYARSIGAKPELVRARAHIYTTHQLREADKSIISEWLQMPLAAAQAAHKLAIEEAKAQALAAPARVELADLGFAALYDAQAQANLTGLMLLGESATFVDADDVAHLLTLAELQTLAKALAAHKNAIYARKLALFATVDAADSPAAVADVIIDFDA